MQRDVTQVPRDLTIDHCYIHGDPIFGQKRGIALNSGKTDIIDSYVSDIKAIGFETQAIAGWNGPGPYRILNNYLEGAGINFLIGGADPGIADLVTDTIEFKRNHLAKPTAWRQPILATPTNVKVTTATGAPARFSGTVYYTIVAAGMAAMDAPVFSRSDDGADRADERARHGHAYVESRGGSDALPGIPQHEARNPNGLSGSHLHLIRRRRQQADAIWRHPRAARWTVKNLFELKNARNVVVDGNLMENCWTDAQNGYAVLFTPRNSDGGAPWTRVENVTFTNNIVRHAPGGINILGRDYIYPSEQTKNIVIRNNLFDDVTTNWGNSLPWLLLGNGADRRDRRSQHDRSHRSLTRPAVCAPTTNFVYTHNMGRNNEYGFIGDSHAPGKDSIDIYLPGATFSKNIIAGANGGIYPDTNANAEVWRDRATPQPQQWQGHFKSFSGVITGC